MDGDQTVEISERHRRSLEALGVLSEDVEAGRVDGLHPCPNPDHGTDGEDRRPSLSVRYLGPGEGVSVNCFGGCPQRDVLDAVGLSLNDIRPGEGSPDLTLEEYAEAKDLPAAFLRRLGLRDGQRKGRPAVEIPYRDTLGTEVFVRHRTAHGLRSPKGQSTLPYGLDRLARLEEGVTILAVEGESDAHTAWLHEFPALSWPGANAVQRADAGYLEGLDVVAWQEPGGGGETFVRKLAGILPSLRVIVAPAGVDDLSDMHMARASDASFQERLSSLLEKAVPAHAVLEGEGLTWDTDVEAVAHRWLVREWLPRGEHSILAGEPGDGKTKLAVRIAAKLSQGVNPFDTGNGPGEPVRTLFVTDEGEMSTDLLPLYRALGGREGYLAHRTSYRGHKGEPVPVTFPQHTDALRRDIAEHGFGLVVVDPLSSVLEVQNSWSEQDVRRALYPIGQMIRETGAALLTIHHLTKDTSKAPIHRITGSIAFIAKARVALYLHREKGEEARDAVRHLIPVKNNLAEFPASVLWEIQSRPHPDHPNAQDGDPTIGVPVPQGPSPLTHVAFFTSGNGARAAPAKAEAESWLMTFLDGRGPVDSREIKAAAKRAGIAAATLQRARAKMKEIVTDRTRDDDGRVTGSTWELQLDF